MQRQRASSCSSPPTPSRTRGHLPIDPPSIAAPALVVAGAHDLPYFRDSAAAIAAGLASAELVELGWAGHLPAIERPDEIARLLLEGSAGGRKAGVPQTESPRVETVRGARSPDGAEDGVDAQHLFVATTEVQLNYPHLWRRRSGSTVRRLTALKRAGVDTIVDPTVIGGARRGPRGADQRPGRHQHHRGHRHLHLW